MALLPTLFRSSVTMPLPGVLITACQAFQNISEIIADPFTPIVFLPSLLIVCVQKLVLAGLASVINTPGKARYCYAELFPNIPRRAGSIRFFAKYENISKLFEGTLKNIMDVIVWCIEYSVLELSANSI